MRAWTCTCTLAGLCSRAPASAHPASNGLCGPLTCCERFRDRARVWCPVRGLVCAWHWCTYMWSHVGCMCVFVPCALVCLRGAGHKRSFWRAGGALPPAHHGKPGRVPGPSSRHAPGGRRCDAARPNHPTQPWLQRTGFALLAHRVVRRTHHAATRRSHDSDGQWAPVLLATSLPWVVVHVCEGVAVL